MKPVTTQPRTERASTRPPLSSDARAAAHLTRRLPLALVLLAFLIGLTDTGCHRAARKIGTPAAEFARGWEMFRGGEYDLAIEAFHAASAGAPPGDRLRLAALYGEATVWNLRRPGMDHDRAMELYRQILDAAPQSDLAAGSLLDQVTMSYPAADVEPNWDALVRGYQGVIDRFPGRPEGEEAFVTQQSIVLRRFAPDTTTEAVTRLERFVADHPDSPFAYCALILAASGHESLGQWRESVTTRQRALENGERVTRQLAGNPANALMMNSLNWMTNCWAIASLSEFQLGDFATARAYYGRIIEKAPADPLYGAALVALTRMDDKEAELRRESAPPAPPAPR